MFIVHKKGIKLDRENPVLLYGYGGFGTSVVPDFDFSIVPFLMDGGVYAVAHLRGGGEYGEVWHDAGRMTNKQNTFDDFVSAAEYLIENRYTNTRKLAIMGGSNGGLLVATCTAQRPDLFRAVICNVPATDMIRYTKFGGAAAWIYEYGDPDKKEEFKYLLKYSPYHNIRKGTEYPSFLLTSSDHDTRVDGMHARKMAAGLQNSTASANPVLLLTMRNIGHGFGMPMNEVIDSYADQWAFIYNELGMSPERHE